ncbi:peptidoglycan-binding protein [Streptomyces sp. MCA2]|uniref:peptidoglycan-binding domain-containing protein n=1 Tax=Streptomyces sp. MCA2 TaxID=2944805 RepID=UPI0020208460|nr:peptidoglycan-binding domain-containing protein [Streptomyces sp. MCA2]MCL7491601.1 peptidoglycan-binding protein [Streptomyces sp. MCA2]
MDFEQHINWTVLPAGLSKDGTQVSVSVFIAPRLVTSDRTTPRTTLGPHFPDFLSWPEKVKAATFDFGTGDRTSASSTPFLSGLKPLGQPPDADLWKSLFGRETPLDPYVFEDHTDPDKFHTYSANEVGTFTKERYVEAAKASPETPPSTRALLRSASDTATGTRDVAMATGDVAADGEPAMPPQLNGLKGFHTLNMPPAPTLANGEPIRRPRPPKQDPDFHQMLTSLGDHPKLLRALGLVLDFVLPANLLPVSSGQRILTVTPNWAPALGNRSHDVAPRTRYVFLPDRHAFVPAGKALTDEEPLPPPSRGLVAVTKNFAVEQADIDAAARKMVSPPKGATGLSPVRTHGISLVRSERLDSLTDEFARAVEHDGAFARVIEQQRNGRGAEPGPQPPGAVAPHEAQEPEAAPELIAEDLIRGHRMDIWDDERQRWFSLHERVVEYRQPRDGPVLLTASDEGFFQAHLASPPSDAKNPDHLYVPEQLVTWDGWSLSAPRPGLVLDIDEGSVEDHRPPNLPKPLNNTAQTQLPLEITAKTRPGSLPRLRFGHHYRVRLRTVDLAGNGLTREEADAALKAESAAAPKDAAALMLPGGAGLQLFQRFEPVLAPAIVPRFAVEEGSSAFRMVIRSSPGTGPPPAGGGTVRTVALVNVKFGKHNDDVRIVQQALIDNGHAHLLPHGADGIFGDETKAAYAEEQRAQGFTGSGADGDPGCKSLTNLGLKSGFAVDCGTGTSSGTGTGTAAGSEAGRTAEQYAADFNRSPLVTAEGHGPYRGTDERHVVAPKASLRCVEWHGLLDEAIGSTDQAVQNAVYDLATRESGSLSDTSPSQPDVQVEPIESSSADPDNPVNTVLHTGERVELPYLPDPLSSGAVFLDLPGMPDGEPFPVSWDGEVWHRPRSLRLRLAEGTAPPRFDEASRVLTVSLPKGVVATVRVCSRIDFDEKVMGMAGWCREQEDSVPRLASETEGEAAARRAAEAQLTDDTLALAAASRHWMFTPWQELTLVHAVQRPMKSPVLTLPPTTVPRAAGATAEHLIGSVALDEGTTDRIDLIAEWTEVTDAGPKGRHIREMAVPVFDLLTAWAAGRNGVPGAEPALLRDGVLTFNTQAAEGKAKADAAAAAAHPANPQGNQDDKPHPLPPNPAKHEFGDTKHRTVRYHPVAGSKFADYFPPQFATPGANKLTVEGAAQEYSVLSSKPPMAPRLLYCVPTLTLEHVGGPPGPIVHQRRGRGIRVYLDRPWFSSGDGELLGVVLGEPPGGDPKSARDACVTLMGRDPIHRSAPVFAPTPEMFTNAERQSGKLSLSTPSGPLPVTVVGFTPQFEAGTPKSDEDSDEDKDKTGRWFCDLDLDTGDACLPFVRLALVRYQPDSIPGAEISSTVVLTDLVRTLPDRELRVTRGDSLSVSLTGPSWDPTGSLPPRITATLQRRNSLVDDADLGWVSLEDTTVQLTSVDAESSRTPFYTGQIPIPPGRRNGPLRLMVLETEGIRPDGPTPPTTPGPVIYCDTVTFSRRPGGPDGGHDGHDGHGDHDGPHGPGDHGPGDHGGGFGGGFHHR